jgi:hypothetical protein
MLLRTPLSFFFSFYFLVVPLPFPVAISARRLPLSVPPPPAVRASLSIPKCSCAAPCSLSRVCSCSMSAACLSPLVELPGRGALVRQPLSVWYSCGSPRSRTRSCSSFGGPFICLCSCSISPSGQQRAFQVSSSAISDLPHRRAPVH